MKYNFNVIQSWSILIRLQTVLLLLLVAALVAALDDVGCVGHLVLVSAAGMPEISGSSGGHLHLLFFFPLLVQQRVCVGGRLLLVRTLSWLLESDGSY